jgi:hypothetical protein
VTEYGDRIPRFSSVTAKTEFSMRLPAIAALFALLVLPQSAGAANTDQGWYLARPAGYAIGAGAVAGMSGNQAVHATGPTYPGFALLRREISLAEWRGKRVRLSLRLKDTPDARGWVNAVVWNADHSAIVSSNLRNKFGSDDWQAHSFVLDVPGNADRAVLSVGMRGEDALQNDGKNGTVWVDGTTVQEVGDGVPLTYGRHLRAGPYANDYWLDLGRSKSIYDDWEFEKGPRVSVPREGQFPPVSVRLGRENKIKR